MNRLCTLYVRAMPVVANVAGIAFRMLVASGSQARRLHSSGLGYEPSLLVLARHAEGRQVLAAVGVVSLCLMAAAIASAAPPPLIVIPIIAVIVLRPIRNLHMFLHCVLAWVLLWSVGAPDDYWTVSACAGFGLGGGWAAAGAIEYAGPVDQETHFRAVERLAAETLRPVSATTFGAGRPFGSRKTQSTGPAGVP